MTYVRKNSSNKPRKKYIKPRNDVPAEFDGVSLICSLP
jgi:hypothetical protein